MADETPWGLPPSPLPPSMDQSPTLVPPDLSPPPGPSVPPAPDLTDSESAGDPFDDTRPEPGSLHLKGGRSWKTWQLVVAVIVAAVVGMWFNGSTGSATSASSGSGGGAYKLPAPSAPAGSPTTVAGSNSTSTTTAGGSGGAISTTTAAGGSGSSTSTTTAGGSGSSTSTTTAGGSASSPAALAPASVLVPATQLTGDWTSPVFNIAGGTWNIGWAFACSPVPASTPTFEVFVVNTGASPGPSPAVTSSAASGQSVTPQTSTGSQQIDVRAPAGCRWAVKVTGSSS